MSDNTDDMNDLVLLATARDEAVSKVKELEAKLAKAVEALVMIADGPSEMVWGVDSEVREKMREMESIADRTLAELSSTERTGR